MSTDPQHPRPRPEPPAARERTAAPLAGGDAEERADLEEDRRRQRDLDDAELGGEA
jgi:hypothetical protein